MALDVPVKKNVQKKLKSKSCYRINALQILKYCSHTAGNVTEWRNAAVYGKDIKRPPANSTKQIMYKGQTVD